VKNGSEAESECSQQGQNIPEKESASELITPKEQPDELSGMDTRKSKLSVLNTRIISVIGVNLESFLNGLKNYLLSIEDIFQECECAESHSKTLVC
jgi:hypothetical protein